MVERAGDLAAVRKGLADEEELITVRYTNWKLPDFTKKETSLAIVLALLGAALVLAVESAGGPRKEDDEGDAEAAG